MAVQLQGNSGIVVEVGGTTHRALRSEPRGPDYGSLGSYQVGVQSGLLTGTGVTAGGTLFSCRWGDATRFAVIHYISAKYTVTTAFTAVQEIGLDVIVARSYTVSDSAGTAMTLTGNSFKKRANMGTTLMTDMRVGATTIVTKGTSTEDAQPIATTSGITHDLNPAAATVKLAVMQPQLVVDYTNGQDMPIVLAQNEGIRIRNTVVFPAAGAARLDVRMAWSEVTAY